MEATKTNADAVIELFEGLAETEQLRVLQRLLRTRLSLNSAITADEKDLILFLKEPQVKPQERSAHPKFGSAKGSVVYMAPDFDAPLEEFEESLK